MRTVARNAAPQRALRNCSKRPRGEGEHICDFVEGKYIQSNIFFCRSFLLVMRNSYHDEGFSAF